MGDGVKLPVRETLRLTFRQSCTIIARHWCMIALYAAIPPLLTLLLKYKINISSTNISIIARGSDYNSFLQWLVAASDIIYCLSLSIPATILHNEVLRGRAGFDADTLGHRPGRILGYILDVIGIAVCAVLAWPVLISVVGVGLELISGVIRTSLPNGITYLIISAVPLGWLALLGRLLLRLPSRAIGPPTPWSQVWQMGRGNTFRLLLCTLVLALPVVLLQVNLFEFFHGPLPSGWYLPITHPAGPIYFALSPIQRVIFEFLKSALNMLGFVAFVAYFSNAFVSLRLPVEPASPS